MLELIMKKYKYMGLTPQKPVIVAESLEEARKIAELDVVKKKGRKRNVRVLGIKDIGKELKEEEKK